MQATMRIGGAGLVAAALFWRSVYLKDCSVGPFGCKEVQGRIIYAPPPPPPFLAIRHFPGGGLGLFFFEAPRGRNLMRPSFMVYKICPSKKVRCVAPSGGCFSDVFSTPMTLVEILPSRTISTQHPEKANLRSKPPLFSQRIH